MKITCMSILSLVVLLGALRAQTPTFSTFGTFTPKGLEPGSPAGSYALSGLDTVNLYNGAANISIPLMQVGGRGDAGYTIQANVTKRPWNVGEASYTAYPCGDICTTTYYNVFEVSNLWANLDVRYKPAVVGARFTNDYGYTSCGAPSTANSLTRITVVMGDNSEMDFVDQDTMGAFNSNVIASNGSCPAYTLQPMNRGPVWVATDASGATFVQDNNQTLADEFTGEGSLPVSGTVYFRDGRQIHFSNGFPTSIMDRNGNTTTFDYSPSCSTTGESDPNAPHCTTVDPGLIPPIVSIDSGSMSPYTDPSGTVWAADNGFSGANTSTTSTSNSIAGTTTPQLYQTARLSGLNTTLTYTFSVPNGRYHVTLKFAQIDMSRCSAGSQTFNVSINGDALLNPLDPYSAVHSCNTAYDLPWTLTVTTGSISIVLTPVNDYAFINGIQVTQTNDNPPNRFDVVDPLGRRTKVRIGNPNPEITTGNGYLDTITSPNGHTVNVYTRDYWNDCPACNGVAPQQITLFPMQGSYTPVSYIGTYKIQIPSGQTYNFLYNLYAEITRMTLPSGGAVEFDLQGGAPGSYGTLCGQSVQANNISEICGGFLGSGVYQVVVSRQVAARREYADANAPAISAPFPAPNYTRLTTYNYVQLAGGVTGIADPLDSSTDPGAQMYRCSQATVPGWPSFSGVGTGNTLPNFCTRTEVQEQDANLGVLAYVQHYFYGSPINLAVLFPGASGLGYSAWMEGKEFRTVTWPVANGQVVLTGTALRDERQAWAQRANVPWWTTTSNIPPPAGDPRLGYSDTVIDNGKLYRHVIGYSPDAANNVADVYDFDYGITPGQPGALLRHTHTDYVTDAAYTQPPVHLRSLPSFQSVDGGGALLSQTQFCYDEATSSGGTSSSAGCTAVTSHQGNVTTLEKWRNTDGLWLNTAAAYDQYGNRTSMQNPRTFTTTYSYTCSNAFLYQVTNAKSQQTTYNYADCNLGKPTSVVDANGTTTSIQYNDPLDRPTHGTLRDGANVDYQYSTDLKTLTVVKDLDAGRRTTTSNTTDGFGRTIQTVDAANVTTLRGLDALGRLHIAYNPGSTTNGTTYTYDALNRTATITYADGSPESFQWTGDFMVHTDPSPTSTQQQVDALGRLLQVVEDNGGANLTTTYTYDALDNLIGVNQPGLTSACTSGQSRCFVYDSLKELTSANSPESGVTNYAYDPNGNLAQRVQGGVTTSFQYDPLDRLAFKTYTGVSTPAVTNCYDGYGSVAGTPDGTCVAGSVPNSTGRLTETRNSVSKTSYTAYDPLGRVLGSVQTTGNQPYTFSYTYNLAGVLTRTTFPSGRSVMNYYDTAGRVCSVSGTQVNPPSLPTSCTVAGTTQVTAYANSVSYTPQGSLQSIARGDQLTETWGYNNRLQATSVNVGTAGSAFGMNLYYCPLHAASCATDNGNVLGLWLVTPGVYEDFTYSDRLNRLTSIQEGSSTQSYGYDSRGNRWLAQNTGTVPLPASSFLATSAADYNSQNQLTRQGAQYADRGNQTAIGLYTFTYDGESRMQTSQLNSGTTTYSYDGDGRRVMKQSPTGTTTYVYDASGDVAAEYGAASTGPCITCYVSVDHLLSTRALTDSSGNVVERHDYMPFGDELFAGTGGRTAAQQYLASPTAETLNTLFSGKYRDPELVSSAMASGLDYFGARYFSAAQGRFTSPDSPSFSKLSYPQTWNLYAYAVNNPLSYIDPTGHEIVCANNAEQCQNDAAAATGNAAAAQRVTTQTTTTQHSFLGLFHWTTSKTTIAISGDINSFRALSQNASRLADLVASKTTVTVTYDQYARPSMWANGIQLKGGSTSYVPTQGYEAQAFIDPGRYGATYDTDAIAQGIPQSNTAEEFAHEVLGHIWGDVIGLHFALKTGTRANMRDSIQAEDVVRALDPTRGQKALESHHNYQDMPPDPRTGCLPCHQ